MAFTNDPALIVNQLPVSIEIPQNQELREIISLLYKRIAAATNSKTGSLYSLNEKGNFEQYQTTAGRPEYLRNVYRKVFDMVALNGGNIPGGATVSFPHGIVGLKFSSLIYASCVSATPQYFTVVYPNVYLDNTNVYFVNPLPSTVITSCTVVAEYLKV